MDGCWQNNWVGETIIYLSIYLSIYPPIHPGGRSNSDPECFSQKCIFSCTSWGATEAIYLSMYLFIYVSIYLSVCLSVRQSVCLCLSACRSVCEYCCKPYGQKKKWCWSVQPFILQFLLKLWYWTDKCLIFHSLFHVACAQCLSKRARPGTAHCAATPDGLLSAARQVWCHCSPSPP